MCSYKYLTKFRKISSTLILSIRKPILLTFRGDTIISFVLSFFFFFHNSLQKGLKEYIFPPGMPHILRAKI